MKTRYLMGAGLVGLIVALVPAGPATAQLSSDGGRIYINADRSESLEREKQVLLIGNVDIQQGDARLRADKITLTFGGRTETSAAPAGQSSGSAGIGASFGTISTMLAEGDVFYVTPELKAKGDRGLYDAKIETITMTGEVALQRGCDVAVGQTLKLDIANGRSALDGGGGRTQMSISDPEAPQSTTSCATGLTPN